MSRPPRIANCLPWEQRTIYFLTFCVDKRKPVLTTPETWSICLSTFAKLNQWTILAAVAMPDRLHIVITPSDREASVSQFVKWFKRWFNATYRKLPNSQLHQPDWKWQEGCFDRLLRSDELLAAKWHYIRQNPVRAGLVSGPDDWPYRFQLDGSQW